MHADLEQLHCGYHHNIPTRLTTPTALTKASYLLRGDRNTRAGVAKRHIRHIRELNRQIDDLATQITAMVRASGTTLTNIYGVGALVAAEILAGVGDPTRYTTKAKFAMANGTAPLEASSRRVVRHRLNRGGNRQLNKAIHTIAITQIARPDTEGRTYYERKLACGKTKREAIRSLKRRISDRIWTHLHNQTPQHLTVRMWGGAFWRFSGLGAGSDVVTLNLTDPEIGVFPMICPTLTTSADLAYRAGLIRSLSTPKGCDSSQSCRSRIAPQPGHNPVRKEERRCPDVGHNGRACDRNRS